jgi:hypothetical protein
MLNAEVNAESYSALIRRLATSAFTSAFSIRHSALP